ncbi:MAG: hypothetical protein Ct9H90mP14_1980 [Methanobacteriota archaeon]|nr:MAG: hypothetical protein Ct9H90mP14_1980 [Euryarchaeota archaeon]
MACPVHKSGLSRNGSGSPIPLKNWGITSHQHTTIDALSHQAEYMFRPLEGVRVFDLSRVLAGPYTAKLLSDLGATVLRVEALGVMILEDGGLHLQSLGK